MYRSRMFVAAVLLICLFPLLSGAAAARPLAVGLAAPAAPATTVFTYQGHLNDDGSPANGSYDFRFILYNALEGGAQVGSTVTVGDVTVTDGLFTVALDFGAVFDGVALWLEIAVRPGASGGAYTILSPRQPLTAAPYALGLRPGTTIRRADFGPALTLDSEGDGLLICSTGSETGCTPEGHNNGVEIGNAEYHGVLVRSAGGSGFAVHSAIHGVVVSDATGNGLQVNDAGSRGLLVSAAGQHGIEVGTVGSSGLHIDHADQDGIFICSVGDETSCTPSISNNGVEIGSAEINGVRVNSAGWNGLNVISAGLNGLYVHSASVNGLYVHSAGYDGLYVHSATEDGIDVFGSDLAGNFRNNIAVDGSCTGCTLATFAVNASDQPLQPGDVVTVQGVQASGVDGAPVLMGVVPASAGQSIVGVVDGRAEIRIDDEPRPDTIGKTLIPRDGLAQPGDYVTIITYGLAPVNVGDSLSARSITAGSKLALDAGGSARSLQTTVVDGIQITESAPTVGLALSNPDTKGQAWVMVNPQ